MVRKFPNPIIEGDRLTLLRTIVPFEARRKSFYKDQANEVGQQRFRLSRWAV
jgi:hypothetical protein